MFRFDTVNTADDDPLMMDNMCGAGQFQCPNSSSSTADCLYFHQLCDGVADCDDNQDER